MVYFWARAAGEYITRAVKRGVKAFVNLLIAGGSFLLAGLLIYFLIELLRLFFDFSVVAWAKNLPFVSTVYRHVTAEIMERSFLGIFYVFTVASLVFTPIPLEPIYLGYLISGASSPLIFLASLTGIIVGQILNYLFGRIFRRALRFNIKDGYTEKIKLQLSKYGPAAILVFHIAPFPFQFINVAVGMLRYNFFKWLLLVIIGLLIKNLLVFWILLSLL